MLEIYWINYEIVHFHKSQLYTYIHLYIPKSIIDNHFHDCVVTPIEIGNDIGVFRLNLWIYYTQIFQMKNEKNTKSDVRWKWWKGIW